MALPECFVADAQGAIPLVPLCEKDFPAWLRGQTEAVRTWVGVNAFKAKPDSFLVLPADSGAIGRVIYGVAENPDLWALASAPKCLPAGDYRLECDWTEAQRGAALLGWGLGAYRFDRYKSARNGNAPRARLVVTEVADGLAAQLAALYRVRDLINTPADDMMPPELACEAKQLAERQGAEFHQIIGEDLLRENYPAIHAVGRASVHAPRLIRLTWGEAAHPLIALVGKGVCFDSGGLDIKSASGMRLMQKDMGGAAHVLGLAEMVMAARLPVRLLVLVPAVENAIAGNAFHPGDVLETRAGKTVEIENTDAEGRLILCDAIAEACRHQPDLLIDFATLTGAARIAVGAEIAAFFTNTRELAQALVAVAARVADPVWELPLHAGYRDMLESQTADLVNSASDGYGGAITAALFLEHFVTRGTPWLHFDMMAWNTRARPGRPKGGEAMGVRAVFELLRERYAG